MKLLQSFELLLEAYVVAVGEPTTEKAQKAVVGILQLSEHMVPRLVNVEAIPAFSWRGVRPYMISSG
jgi:hypothetical protein